MVDQSTESPAFYGGVLHIVVQLAETRVPPLLFNGLPGNLIGLEDPVYNPFV